MELGSDVSNCIDIPNEHSIFSSDIDNKFQPTNTEDDDRQIFSDIAKLLIFDCHLGKLSKRQLRDCMNEFVNNDDGIELKRFISEEFYKFNLTNY